MHFYRQRVVTLVIAWLCAFAMPAQAVEPAIHVMADFTCRGAPASHDMSAISISDKDWSWPPPSRRHSLWQAAMR